MAEKAYITPKVLRWARETAKLSLDQAASKVSGLTPEKLARWEEGTDHPTIRQAEILAKAYRRPFAVFFLPDIPRDFQPLQDYRRKGSKELSTSAVFILRDLQEKHSWISELNKENDEPVLPFVGRFSLSDDPRTIANDLLRTLGIDPKAYEGNEPFREWMTKAEALGIFISRTSFIHSRMKLDSDEFQGFAIADPYAPFVFINTEDWDKAQLFTLVHELAHIWIAATGISTDVQPEALTVDVHPVERFCNAVAAHALMPDEVMAQLERKDLSSSRSLRTIADRYGVSSWVLLVRALERGQISHEGYRNMKSTLDREFNEYLKLQAEKNEGREKPKGGPNPYLLRLNKNGRLFTQVVLDAFRGGVIQPTVASQLLNTPVNHFSKFEVFLYK